MLSLILDVAIILLMAVTLFGIWRLSRYLKIFRQSRDDMSKLLRDLSGAAERADQSIQDLRRSASEGGRKLQKKMDQARSLIDELQFITAAAGNVADRLEKMTDAGGKKIRGEDAEEPAQAQSEGEADLPSGAETEVTGNERPFNQMGDTSTDYGEVEGDERRSRAEEELLRAIRERRGKS
jgi:hypothetical protein